jgi:hypothetical protein
MPRRAARVALLLSASLLAAGLATPATASSEPAPDAIAFDGLRQRVPAPSADAQAQDLLRAAQVGVGGRFLPVGHPRVIDTREEVEGKLGPQEEAWYDFSDVPEDVIALVLNVTVTGGTARTSFVTVLDGNAPDAIPTTSSVNSTRGRDVANLVTVPLTEDRYIGFYNNSGFTHVIADLAGYYSTQGGAGFVPVSPQRVFDGRKDGAHRSGEVKFIPMPTAPADTVAVAFTLTSTQTEARTTYVGLRSTNSVLNSYRGTDVPNLVVAQFNQRTRGVSLYNSQGVNHLIVDVVGWYVEKGGANYHPLPAKRAAGSGLMGAAESRTFTPASAKVAVPSTATAVALNLTTAGATRPTYLTVHPSGSPRPLASSTNARVGADVATAVMTRVNPGFTVYNNSGSVRALVDVNGYFAPGQ